jgi:hypothetical protein
MSFAKQAIKAARSVAQRIRPRQADQSSAPLSPGRKDNMAGMAIEAKKGGLMSKMKMVMKNGKKVPAFAADGVGKMKKGGMADTMGRAVKRKTADVKGRAMKKGK